MIDRLVLGSGPLVSTVVGSVAEQPGTVRVVTDDDSAAERLREDGISVIAGDPSESSTLEQIDDPDIIVTLAETQAENSAAARAARRVFPNAYLLAYVGDDAADRGSPVEKIVDKVIHPGRATASYLMDRVGDAGRQTRQLWRLLRELDSVAVLTHDNPDPDAIASGVALARLAEVAGCDATVCYFGNINHQENRAFVNVLSLDLRNVEHHEELEEFDGLALVDHSRPGVNDQLPAETPVDIVIDHHPPRMPVDARFVDLRSDVGATSTLLVDYLDQFGLVDERNVATAILFGIHVDTAGFSREVSERDFSAAATLLPYADLGSIERIESPSISPGTLETLAFAIQNRQIESGILLSCVGQLSDRDALAQAADRLLMLEDVTVTVVYGFSDGMIYVSARSRGAKINLGETLREAFDRIGSAGGHVDMAGAQITLGVLEAVEDRDESLQEIVESVVRNRFLEAVDTAETSAGETAYPPESAEGYVEVDGDREDEGTADERPGEESPPDQSIYGSASEETPLQAASGRTETEEGEQGSEETTSDGRSGNSPS